jgi:hypothetical protein
MIMERNGQIRQLESPAFKLYSVHCFEDANGKTYWATREDMTAGGDGRWTWVDDWRYRGIFTEQALMRMIDDHVRYCREKGYPIPVYTIRQEITIPYVTYMRFARTNYFPIQVKCDVKEVERHASAQDEIDYSFKA